MSQFVYEESKSKQLANYLIEEAVSYTENIINSIEAIIEE